MFSNRLRWSSSINSEAAYMGHTKAANILF
jgi:hypothetical protein